MYYFLGFLLLLATVLVSQFLQSFGNRCIEKDDKAGAFTAFIFLLVVLAFDVWIFGSALKYIMTQ